MNQKFDTTEEKQTIQLNSRISIFAFLRGRELDRRADIEGNWKLKQPTRSKRFFNTHSSSKQTVYTFFLKHIWTFSMTNYKQFNTFKRIENFKVYSPTTME